MTTLCKMLAALAAAMFVTASLAQPAPGMGGPGGGWKGWAWDSETVPGWKLMTPEERTEHQNKMRSMQSYEQCEAYHKEHRQLMEQRAKDKGLTMATPRKDPCDMMKARGIFK